MRTRLALLSTAFMFLACPPATSTPDGSTPSDADGGSGGGGGQMTADGGRANAPTLASLKAQISSRTGRDLTVTVVGKDRDLDIASAWVKLQDAQGNPVNAIDTNRDGTPDTAETPARFGTQKLVGETLTAEATLVGVLAKARVAKVTVALLDATGLRSEELSAEVTDQPVRDLSSPCDPTFITDRCAVGLGCRGTPPTCQEGLPPQVGRFAFYKSAKGPSILVEGTEPEDDLAAIRFEFRNAQGQAISIDSDGDDVPDLRTYDFDATGAAFNGTFFVSMQPAINFDTQVPILVATPIDGAGHLGATKTTTPVVIPIRGSGQACDARGFDVCGPDLICSPRVVGQSNKCAAASTLRATACAAAPVLLASASGARHLGATKGISLWNTPSGCSSDDPVNRPDAIVKVRLTERANKLTLSTASAATTFDTALYVLLACPSSTASALGCSDDAPGANGASKLELPDMPAGDYLVVIDSFDDAGGAFELTATVE
jgi:hypothetical protein